MAASWEKMNQPPYLAYLDSSSSLDCLLGVRSSPEIVELRLPTFVQRSSKSMACSSCSFNSLMPMYILFFSPSRYTENDITEVEFNKLNPRSQDQLRRSAAANQQASQPQTQPWGYYTPAAMPERLRRVGKSHHIPFLYPKNFNAFFRRLVAGESIFWRDIERRQLCPATFGIQGFKCLHYGLDFMIFWHKVVSVFLLVWLIGNTLRILVTAFWTYSNFRVTRLQEVFKLKTILYTYGIRSVCNSGLWLNGNYWNKWF